MNPTYYLRWKAQVSGPFPSEDIKSMLQEGRISKHHQVSTDRAVWTPLQEADGFCTVCNTRPATTLSVTPTVASAVSMQIAKQADAAQSDTSDVRKLRLKSMDDETHEDRWYYVENGQSAGPVTMWELRQLVDAKEILKDCPVCKEGEERWVKAGIAFPSLWHVETTQHVQSLGVPPQISNHLTQSILVTLFCCLPFGIPAIVYASQVNSKIQAGDIQGAINASRQANMWGWISFGVGLAVSIVYGISVL